MHLTEKQTLKALFFFWKQWKSESLAEVQFVFDSRHLVSQSIIWTILTRIVIGLS